jgi:hypothetical protein
MVSILFLLLPILLSAVVVFIASSILHMVLKYHQSDCHQLPNENKLLETLRPDNLAPGLYMFPYCHPKERNKPENVERFNAGPVGLLTIFPSGLPNMAKFLSQWFGYCVLISIFVAYLTRHTVPVGAPCLEVLRVAGTAAFLAYGLGNVSNGIWKGQSWSMTLKEVFDGLVFGLLTGVVFACLWPH